MHGTHLEDLTTGSSRARPRTCCCGSSSPSSSSSSSGPALTELDRTVRGQGRVMPSSQLQVVSNLEGGVVQDILVRSGQQVRAGDELIRLDRTQTGAEFGSGEATLSALDHQDRPARGRGRGPRAASIPPRADPVARRPDPDRAGAARLAHGRSRRRSLGAAQARVSQAERAVAEAEAAYQARSTAYEQRRAEARLIRPAGRARHRAAAQPDPGRKRRPTIAAERDAGGRASVIGRARSGVAEARSSLAQRAQEWRAQRRRPSSPPPRPSIAARRRALPALADRAERTVLRAPLAGRINRVLVTTRGGSVRAGRAGGRDRARPTRACWSRRGSRPQDIAFVRIGQQARVAITAYDRVGLRRARRQRRRHLARRGARGADRRDLLHRSRSAPTQNVAARPRRPARCRSAPGMVAEVDLLGDKRTILQYILSPITRLGETALRER